MKKTRSELRESIMVVLYQIELYKKSKIEYDVKEIIKNVCEIENSFVSDIVFGVIEKEKELDEIINKNLKNWTIDRLGFTDASILRLSVYELLYYDTPEVVSINEAIELAKKYSDEKVVKIINAVLDSINNQEETNE